MDKSTLKKIRLVAPGIILFVCVFPFFGLRNLKAISENIPDSAFIILMTLLVLVLGAVYYSLNIRDLLWREVVQACHRNIHARMIDPVGLDPIFEEVISRLSNTEMMNIFYNIVDHDPSLLDKANDVRSNGAVLTSIIDSILIFYFFTIMYIITFLLTHQPIFLWWTIATLLLQMILWPMKRRVLKRHIMYEDEQLSVINQFHRDRVKSLLRGNISR